MPDFLSLLDPLELLNGPLAELLAKLRAGLLIKPLAEPLAELLAEPLTDLLALVEQQAYEILLTPAVSYDP